MRVWRSKSPGHSVLGPGAMFSSMVYTPGYSIGALVQHRFRLHKFKELCRVLPVRHIFPASTGSEDLRALGVSPASW